MPPFREDERRSAAPRDAARRQLARWHARWRRAAQATFAAGSAGVVFLCASGLKPPAVAIPVFLAVMSLMLAAGSAALFARVVHLQLIELGQDTDDESGGGWDPPEPSAEPPDGGGLQVDWERFERDFRSYCERVPVGVS